MIYFDTDILVHYLVIQDKQKHLLAKKLYEKATSNEPFFISLLTLQESAFVLGKLEIENFEIAEKLEIFYASNPVNYSFEEYIRGTEIGKKIGLKCINDCLHTGIAETYCDELYTFNQTDFKRIKNYTSLKINILS